MGRFDKVAVHGTETQVKGGRDGKTRYSRGGAYGRDGSAKSRSCEGRVCFYCLDAGHLIADCNVWKKKNLSNKSKTVGFVNSVSPISPLSGYEPFILHG